MRFRLILLLLGGTVVGCIASEPGTVPTFQYTVAERSYTLAGGDPGQGGITRIGTLLVPITLSFDTRKSAGKPLVLDAGPDVASVLRSPVFSDFRFPSGETAQYADGMLRATFPGARGWHTRLDSPSVNAIRVTVPAGSGYVLTSKSTGEWLGVVDVEFLQRELFKQVPRQEGKLVIAVAHNTTFYALGDATVCCSWGTHGVDSATGNSFVLSSFLDAAPAPVEERDVQPLTQQLAEFINDPLHDPFASGRDAKAPGNMFPAWLMPSTGGSERRGCGGTGVASTYFLLESTDTNRRSNVPASNAFIARAGDHTYHLQNVALLPWYTGSSTGLGAQYSFPDAHVLGEPFKPCPERARDTFALPRPRAAAAAASGPANGHKLIGYWAGYGTAGSVFPLRQVSPQWDIIIVAFSTPDKNAPEGTMQFHTPAGFSSEQFKADIAYLKSRGKRVMVSLGGGGQYFALADERRIPDFVSSVTGIVSEYGFDGIDLDFETPSLSLESGDTDFRHPTTPSIVNLISGLRQLRQHFGPGFLISLVPEGTQMPGGYPSYGGQFGSYLPLTYAIRDMLSFVDVQDYNTPPLQGPDGEIYELGSGVDYHAAMTELLLHGFYVGGDPDQFFPPLPADQVAVGFLTGETTPEIVGESMKYLITGNAPRTAKYKLLKSDGYRDMIGAMFWTIDADARANYRFSNVIGPQLHRYRAGR